MRVALDVRATQSRQYGERGVARYTRGLVDGLLAIDAPLAALLLDPNQPPLDPAPESWTRSGLLVEGTTTAIRRLPRPFALHWASPFEMGRPVGTGTSGVGIELADRLVATIHDLIPAVMPEIYLQDHAVRRTYQARLRVLREADLLLAISDDCRNDIIELLGVDPDRVATVYSATNQPPAPDDPGDDATVLARSLPELTRQPVLSTTGYEPRKNTLALIDAYARLEPSVRRQLQLVLVCSIPPHGREAWHARARENGLADDEVVVAGSVSDRVLAALHRAAVLEVFPSLAEGFGLPVLEAAHARTPVVTSSTTATPEILDLPESTFDPRDVDDMADTMASALHDDDLRARLVAAGDAAAERYTWEKVAQRTAAAYERLEPRRRPRRPPRERVALVGPWPPAVSGVATYNARVARSLGTAVDLTVLAEHAEWTPEARAHRLHPIETLGLQIDPQAFDRRIHTLGNSLVHRRTLLAALDGPDVVWLHETDLRQLHVLAAQLIEREHGTERAVEWMGERLAANGATTERAAGLVSGTSSTDELPDMVQELAVAARLVIVHTDRAREAVAAAGGRRIEVLPLAVPSRSDLHVAGRAPTDPPTIASFGILSATKRPESVLAGFAELCRRRPARLAFVGPSDDDLRAELSAAADAAGVGEAVVFTGHVGAREYGRWLSVASVAVQLRRDQNGARSGAITDALGAGIPVVTDMDSEAGPSISLVGAGCDPVELASALDAALDTPPSEDPEPTFDAVAARLVGAMSGDERSPGA